MHKRQALLGRIFPKSFYILSFSSPPESTLLQALYEENIASLQEMWIKVKRRLC
jgi:hypothetical protein